MNMATTNSLFDPSRQQRVAMISRKRRPVDPPEEGVSNNVESYAHLMPSLSTHMTANPIAFRANPPNKRMRTVDNCLESLSLRPADPPGHYKGLKNNEPMGTKEDGDEHINQLVHMNLAPTNGTEVAYFAGSMNDAPTSCASTIATANKRSILEQPTPLQQQQFTNEKKQQYRRREQSSSGISDTGNSEMSLEGSEIDSGSSIDSFSVGSVSESSIRNAMYQVVFGRRGNSGSVGGSSNYDVVDCKIEDLIRRSRMEAAIKCEKEKGQESWTHEKNGDDGTNEMDLD